MIKIIAFLSLLSFSALAAAEDKYFEIHIKDLKSFLVKKLVDLKEEPFCKVYIYKNKVDIEISVKELSIKEILRKYCENKVELILGSDREDYLLNFEFHEKNNDYNIYLDKTGVAEVNEKWVSESDDTLSIIEKRSIGTTRIKYIYKDKRISEVEVSSFEGAQSIEGKHKIEYLKVDNIMLPNRISSHYVQKLSKRDIGDFQRNFNEEIIFKNYKIDKNVALNHFSKN